jgi:hypothetical protein
MVRVGLLAAMYEAMERHGTSAADEPPALGDASRGIAVADIAADLSARRDIARRMTGMDSAIADAGMPSTIPMSFSHTHNMGDSLPAPSELHDIIVEDYTLRRPVPRYSPG